MIQELNETGQQIFLQKYAYPGELKYSERCKVVARHIASVESPDEIESVEKRFYDILASGDFIPGGRILFGSGRNGGKQNLLNCYVIIPDDSVESIGKTIQDMYKISCAGGGIGFNFSKIRPKGDDIQNIKNSAPGSVSVMKMINEIGEHVRAGKNRRTALIAILDVTHPDLLEFLTVKLDKAQLNNFNISVGVTKRFLEAAENGEEWYFHYGNSKYYVYEVNRYTPSYQDPKYVDEVHREINETIEIVALNEEDAINRAKEHYLTNWRNEFTNAKKKTIYAKDIWNKIWRNAVEVGCPGIYNIDLANEYTTVSYFEKLLSTNPCGEIPLPSYGNCCLGHINLSNMVLNGEVDWRKLARTIKLGVRFLDNVLTVNHFPNSECKEVGQKSRRIGLGLTGLHHMLIKLGIRYGSEKCIEFLERLGATFRNEAYKSSSFLARDKGVFPEFNAKKYLETDFAKTLPSRIRFLVKENGMRNAVLLTIAPVGTTSFMFGLSSGIEPIFSAIAKRRYRKGTAWAETIVLDPLFEEYYTNKLPLENFVGAYDVTPEEHMAVQATLQKFIDSSISKTINLPEDIDSSSLEDIALKYAFDLKGMTIYRSGSKGEEPLIPIPLTAENVKKYTNLSYDKEVTSGDSCNINGGDCG